MSHNKLPINRARPRIPGWIDPLNVRESDRTDDREPLHGLWGSNISPTSRVHSESRVWSVGKSCRGLKRPCRAAPHQHNAFTPAIRTVDSTGKASDGRVSHYTATRSLASLSASFYPSSPQAAHRQDRAAGLVHTRPCATDRTLPSPSDARIHNLQRPAALHAVIAPADVSTGREALADTAAPNLPSIDIGVSAGKCEIMQWQVLLQDTEETLGIVRSRKAVLEGSSPTVSPLAAAQCIHAQAEAVTAWLQQQQQLDKVRVASSQPLDSLGLMTGFQAAAGMPASSPDPLLKLQASTHAISKIAMAASQQLTPSRSAPAVIPSRKTDSHEPSKRTRIVKMPSTQSLEVDWLTPFTPVQNQMQSATAHSSAQPSMLHLNSVSQHAAVDVHDLPTLDSLLWRHAQQQTHPQDLALLQPQAVIDFGGCRAADAPMLMPTLHQLSEHDQVQQHLTSGQMLSNTAGLSESDQAKVEEARSIVQLPGNKHIASKTSLQSCLTDLPNESQCIHEEPAHSPPPVSELHELGVSQRSTHQQALDAALQTNQLADQQQAAAALDQPANLPAVVLQQVNSISVHELPLDTPEPASDMQQNSASSLLLLEADVSSQEPWHSTAGQQERQSVHSSTAHQTFSTSLEMPPCQHQLSESQLDGGKQSSDPAGLQIQQSECSTEQLRTGDCTAHALGDEQHTGAGTVMTEGGSSEQMHHVQTGQDAYVATPHQYVQSRMPGVQPAAAGEVSEQATYVVESVHRPQAQQHQSETPAFAEPQAQQHQSETLTFAEPQAQQHQSETHAFADPGTQLAEGTQQLSLLMPAEAQAGSTHQCQPNEQPEAQQQQAKTQAGMDQQAKGEHAQRFEAPQQVHFQAQAQPEQSTLPQAEIQPVQQLHTEPEVETEQQDQTQHDPEVEQQQQLQVGEHRQGESDTIQQSPVDQQQQAEEEKQEAEQQEAEQQLQAELLPLPKPERQLSKYCDPVLTEEHHLEQQAQPQTKLQSSPHVLTSPKQQQQQQLLQHGTGVKPCVPDAGGDTYALTQSAGREPSTASPAGPLTKLHTELGSQISSIDSSAINDRAEQPCQVGDVSSQAPAATCTDMDTAMAPLPNTERVGISASSTVTHQLDSSAAESPGSQALGSPTSMPAQSPCANTCTSSHPTDLGTNACLSSTHDSIHRGLVSAVVDCWQVIAVDRNASSPVGSAAVNSTNLQSCDDEGSSADMQPTLHQPCAAQVVSSAWQSLVGDMGISTEAVMDCPVDPGHDGVSSLPPLAVVNMSSNAQTDCPLATAVRAASDLHCPPADMPGSPAAVGADSKQPCAAGGTSNLQAATSDEAGASEMQSMPMQSVAAQVGMSLLTPNGMGSHADAVPRTCQLTTSASAAVSSQIDSAGGSSGVQEQSHKLRNPTEQQAQAGGTGAPAESCQWLAVQQASLPPGQLGMQQQQQALAGSIQHQHSDASTQTLAHGWMETAGMQLQTAREPVAVHAHSNHHGHAGKGSDAFMQQGWRAQLMNLHVPSGFPVAVHESDLPHRLHIGGHAGRAALVGEYTSALRAISQEPKHERFKSGGIAHSAPDKPEADFFLGSHPELTPRYTQGVMLLKQAASAASGLDYSAASGSLLHVPQGVGSRRSMVNPKTNVKLDGIGCEMSAPAAQQEREVCSRNQPSLHIQANHCLPDGPFGPGSSRRAALPGLNRLNSFWAKQDDFLAGKL